MLPEMDRDDRVVALVHVDGAAVPGDNRAHRGEPQTTSRGFCSEEGLEDLILYLTGDVSSVNSAMDAGIDVLQGTGLVLSHVVIPSPTPDIGRSIL